MVFRSVLCVAVVTGTLFTGCNPAGRYFSALKSSKIEIRRDAALQLNGFVAFNKNDIPDLLAAAKDDDLVVREYALKALSRVPSKTKGISEVIRYSLRDTNIAIRRTAVAVFSTMNPVPGDILIPLAEALADKDSLLYSYVKSTFLDLGPIGVNALVYSCKSANTELQCRAAATLGVIGCDAKRALPMLQTMLNDEDDNVRQVAKSSIEKIRFSYLCNEGPVVQ